MQRHPRNGLTVFELLMEYVVPVVGVMIATFVLRHTTLPLWSCVALALPLGVVGGWLVVIVLVVSIDLVMKPFEFVRDRRQRRIRDRFNDS